MKQSLSTCRAMLGYSSEIHVPVSPCWLNLNFDAGQDAAARPDLAVILLKLRLVIPGVHLRGGAVHEQEDDPLGLTGEVRRLRRQRAGRGPVVRRLLDRLRRVLPEQAGQREVAEARAGVLQDLAAGDSARR